MACSNNQAQLHAHVSVTYWSPDIWLGLDLLPDVQLGLPAILNCSLASYQSIATIITCMCVMNAHINMPEVGVATPNFVGCVSCASGWTPLSKFLDPPLLLHHTNWTLLGLSRWILSHPSPRTNCCQNWLLPYTATPACIACHSVHWRCQKVKWWPMKGGLHSCGSQGQSAHSIYLCFCTTSNPLGLFPGHFTRQPATRKLNRGVAPASEGILVLPEFR